MALGHKSVLKKGTQGWQVEVRQVCAKEVRAGAWSRTLMTVLGHSGG